MRQTDSKRRSFAASSQRSTSPVALDFRIASSQTLIAPSIGCQRPSRSRRWQRSCAPASPSYVTAAPIRVAAVRRAAEEVCGTLRHSAERLYSTLERPRQLVAELLPLTWIARERLGARQSCLLYAMGLTLLYLR